MSIINYESPLVTVTKVNGDYQATVQADSAYLISSIESTTQTPSEGAEWTQLESHGEGEDTGILNSGKYVIIRPILSVDNTNVNYRIKTVPVSFAVNLHRNHSNTDNEVVYRYIDHSDRQLNRGGITIGGHTYVFMRDGDSIEFPSQWTFPSGFNTFVGWNTVSDGSGETVTNCLSVGNDIDLYAIYDIVINSPSIRYAPDTNRKYFEMTSNNDDIVGVTMYYVFEIPGYSDTNTHEYHTPVSLPHSGTQIQPQDQIVIWCEFNGQCTNPIRVSLSENLSDDWYPSLINNI